MEVTACPDFARASNGDTVAVRAQGDLNTANGSASGGGTFEPRNSAGDLIGSGTITANLLIAFSFYGCAAPPFPPGLQLSGWTWCTHIAVTPRSGLARSAEFRLGRTSGAAAAGSAITAATTNAS